MRLQERGAYAFEEFVGSEWLLEVTTNSSLTRARLLQVSWMRRNQDGGNCPTRCDDAVMQVEPAHAVHAHVGDQAGGDPAKRRLQEAFRAFERRRAQTGCPEQVLDPGADRGVVVDDCNKWWFRHCGSQLGEPA